MVCEHIIKITVSFESNNLFVSWFTYKAHNLGDKIPSWRTPLQIVKYGKFDLPHFMHTCCIRYQNSRTRTINSGV